MFTFLRPHFLECEIKNRLYIVIITKKEFKQLKKLGKSAEITRFKGLGEISPNEFKYFIGDNMRLDPVIIGSDTKIEEILKYFMGKNTPERQEFIIDNLKVEEDLEKEHEEIIS